MRRRRNGFALLTVLWLVAALSGVVAGALLAARLGAATSRNRIMLSRGWWARESCAEMLLAKYASGQAVRLLDTVDLGRGTWCRAELEDASSRLDLNAASAEALESVIGSDSLVESLLDWRDADELPRASGAEADWYRAHGRRTPRNGPLADVAELRLVRGFDSAEVERLRPLLGTGAGGRLNLNSVPLEILRAVPGMSAEAVEVILRRRLSARPVASTDELLTLLSSEARRHLLDRYQDFSSVALYSPVTLIGHIEGGVRGTRLVSRETLTLVPVTGRLAVLRRATD
jgi:general secretion pathway protein K